MPDDPAAPNTVTPAVRTRSAIQGDVPATIQRRYYTDGRGGAGLGFYVDAKVDKPAFRDEGRRLAAIRSDPNAIRDMALIAQHRGWSMVTVRGTPEFKREAWIAGRTIGIEVRGYRPTERDIQELDRRIDRRLAAQERGQRVRNHPNEDRSPVDTANVERKPREARAGRDQLRVVEAVVRARVADPSAQARILAGARERIADWLERGARFEPVRTQDRSVAPQPERTRSR
jgi:hypothetical protein